MNRSSLFVLSLLLSSTAWFGQTTPGDAETLQALLWEVRKLRQDLQTTTIAGQRAQILIYRLKGQEAAVTRWWGSANPAAVGVLPIAEPEVFENHPGLSAQNKLLKKAEGPGQIMTSDSSVASERIVSETTIISAECDLSRQASGRLEFGLPGIGPRLRSLPRIAV